MTQLICYATKKQRELLGTKIALLIAKFISEHFPESMIQVYGNDNEYRAKLDIRHNTKRVSVKMRKGNIEIKQIGAPPGAVQYQYRGSKKTLYAPVNSRQEISDKEWSIPLADPKAFENAAERTKELLDE